MRRYKMLGVTIDGGLQFVETDTGHWSLSAEAEREIERAKSVENNEELRAINDLCVEYGGVGFGRIDFLREKLASRAGMQKQIDENFARESNYKKTIETQAALMKHDCQRADRLSGLLDESKRKVGLLEAAREGEFREYEKKIAALEKAIDAQSSLLYSTREKEIEALTRGNEVLFKNLQAERDSREALKKNLRNAELRIKGLMKAATEDADTCKCGHPNRNHRLADGACWNCACPGYTKP